MKHEAGQPVRVLVVDDSRAQLALMVGMLRQDRRFEVVGTALDGRTAVDATARLRPHVVAMDIHLPQMDGYEATRQIMRSCPTPIVLVSSSTGDAQRRAVQALAAGALAVLPKPKGGVGGLSSVEQDNLLTTLRLMADVPVVTRHTPYEPRPLPPAPGSAQPQLLAIAASTGGPAALRTLLAGLGGDFPLPILVAQHISRGFVGPLAEWLDQCVSLSIKVALPEERLLPGTAYLAPDDCHLLTRARGFATARACAPEDRYCPSADVLFETLARTYGADAIGVVLTGMGDDGARGLSALHKSGATVFAQDEASSVVYGMPQAALRAGAVTQTVGLSAMAEAILRRLHRARISV